MTLEVGQKAIDFFLALTGHLCIRFFGGEPLLQFELMKALTLYSEVEARAQNKKVEFIMVTNATLLSREKTLFCREHSIQYSLSFDGCRESQDANRVFCNGDGSFETIDKNVDHILEINPGTHIVAVMNPENMSYLADTFSYFMNRGFKSITLSPDYTHPGFHDSLPALEKELYRLADRYVAHVRSGNGLYLDIFRQRDIFHGWGRCGLGMEDFSVSTDGRIYPCACFVDKDKYQLGHIESGFDATRYDAFKQEYNRLEANLETVHKDCPETSFCRRGCGCTNMVTTGVMSETSSVLCEYGRVEQRVREYTAEKLKAV